MTKIGHFLSFCVAFLNAFSESLKFGPSFFAQHFYIPFVRSLLDTSNFKITYKFQLDTSSNLETRKSPAWCAICVTGDICDATVFILPNL